MNRPYFLFLVCLCVICAPNLNFNHLFIFQKYERSYQILQNLIAGLSDKEAHDALNNAVLKEKGHDEISLGLLVTILTEPPNASKCYRDLTLITRDGLGSVLSYLSQLVLEKYLRFNDTVRLQLIWLLREMIKNSVCNVDNLCWNLMRHAAGGDVSPRNISLIESLLDLYIEYKSWLEKFPVLLASVVYTYLRLIEDHNALILAKLRQKEVTFLVTILREKFVDCLVIGRDLVRLLQNVARIPEFEQLWKDLLLSPKSLCSNFNGILQLLQTRTSRRFLQSRLTPEMERKLVFLTSQVRFGNHKRYQEWFQRQYLSTAESQSLRCDMIRFIVGVIHPTNELLCSDIIPRWAVIGWLLTTCTSSVAVSNAKLALFYDWLFFESDKDNIMNIEPAILVMHHSMRSHPAVSATLLDFLCRIIGNFYPPLTDKVRSGIFSSLRQILDKRVLPSLLPLFDNSKLDRELRVMVRDTFKEFCSSPVSESSSKADDIKMEDTESVVKSRVNNVVNNHILDNEPAFSDEEEDLGITITTPEDDTDDDDIPLAKVRLKEKTVEKSDESLLEGPLKNYIVRLQTEKVQEKKCEALDALLTEAINLDLDDEATSSLAKCLCNVLQDDIKVSFPKVLDDETLKESVKAPFFVLYRTLYDLCKQDNRDREFILKLISDMYNVQSNLGFYLLYYLKVEQIRTDQIKEDNAKSNSLKVSVYKEFCHFVEKKIDICLYDDLNSCHTDNTDLMLWLVPDLYKDFKQQLTNNSQILHTIVSVMDAKQLQHLLVLVMQGTLTMFKMDSVQNLLKASLSWETVEQLFLWQLLHVHNVSVENVAPLIPILDYNKHAEALTAVLLILKQEQPSADCLRYLFLRDLRDDDTFVFTIIKHWCDDYMDKLGELLYNLLNSRYNSNSPYKRKRGGTKSLNASVPSSDQILGHLDKLRLQFRSQDIINFFNSDHLQRGLSIAYSNGGDSLKRQFSQLFALTDDDNSTSNKGRNQGRGRKASGKARRIISMTKDDVESSGESSDVSSISSNYLIYHKYLL